MEEVGRVVESWAGGFVKTGLGRYLHTESSRTLIFCGGLAGSSSGPVALRPSGVSVCEEEEQVEGGHGG